MSNNGKYHESASLYDWLMLNVATKVEGEKLLSLNHHFDTQITDTQSNEKCSFKTMSKNKVLAGSVGLPYRVFFLWFLDNEYKESQCT